MKPIEFFFDFASPYAYCAVPELERIARDVDRPITWRPFLMWAVLKAHGIAPPMDVPIKRDYFLHDMKRSAAYHGLPYREPAKLPLSSHLAARLWYVVHDHDPHAARRLATRLFAAFFAEGQDISSKDTLLALAQDCALAPDQASEALDGPLGRALLTQAVEDAVEKGVVGSPFFIVEGEPFFGADRLPHLRWFLKEDEVRGTATSAER